MSESPEPAAEGLDRPDERARVAEPVGRGRFDAFISYSRAVDGKLAPALQSAIQRFAKPWYRLRALRVFRDDASLSANPGLWSSIESALASSEFFVLLASPQAASSTWVGREVSWWVEHKRERLLIVLTDGEIFWDEQAGDFDWERTTALPAAVGGAFREEPRYIDFRWARTKEHVSLRDPRFREAVADVAAPLHGRPKDELIGEEVRQHRRTVRLARAAASALGALVIATTAAAFYAFDQRDTARSERDRAEANLRVATSRSLSDEALDAFDKKLDLGLLLALQALRTAPTVQARNAVVTAVQRSERVRYSLPDDPDGVDHIALSSEGSTLAATSVNGHVTIWDLRSRRATRVFDRGGEQDEPVEDAAFGPQGMLAFGGGFGTVSLWDAATGRRVAMLPSDVHRAAVVAVAFTRDRRKLASGDEEGTVVLWDVARRKAIATLDAKLDELAASSFEGVGALAFSPRGRNLAFGGADGSVTLWVLGARPRRVRLGQHGDAATSVVFEGALENALWSASVSGTIKAWQGPPVTGRFFTGRSYRADAGSANAIAASRDGRMLATGGDDGTIRLWNLSSSGPPRTLEGHSQPVTGLAFGPDGTLVSGSADGTVKAWDVEPAAGLAERVQALGHEVDRVAVSPDGGVLATGGLGQVRFWDAATRRPLSRWLEAHNGEVVTGLEFDPSGRTLASSGDDGTVALWNVDERRRLGKPLRPRQQPQGYTDVDPLAFSPDGKLLASTASEDAVTIIDVATRKAVGGSLQDQGDELASVAFSPDGRVVATGTRDGSINLWNVSSRRRLGQALRVRGLEGFSTVSALAFSPDGRVLASAGDDRVVRLWDVQARRSLGEPLRGHRGPVTAVAFTRDGSTLASGSDDGTMRLWDVATGRALGQPLGDGRGEITSVAFGADGRTLATAGTSSGVRLWSHLLWDASSPDVSERLCAAAGRNLTTAEWADFVTNQPYRKLCPGVPARPRYATG